tara:strand:- start:830 stop:1915 length:1086 start_codon:yes stop_codon:yes gene_type:complete
MRKILLISHGNSIHTIKWVSALQKKYKIFLFDWRPINEDNYDDLDNVVLLQSKKNGANENPFLSYCKAFFKIKKISKKLLPDLIHAHYASSYGLLGIKAKNTLLITSVWGTDITDFPYKSIFHKKIIKYVLKKSDYIFVTSNFLSKEVKMISGYDSFITPFGVEQNKKNYYENKNDAVVFGTVKNITKFSGIDIAIECFAKLKKNNPDKKIKYEIAGDGPFIKKIESLIYKLGLDNDVNLIGYLDHKKINEFLSKIDVYINLPEKESFGVAVLEASAAEIPVIVSDVGGLPEVVIHGETGLIINRNKKSEIVDAMNSFIVEDKKITKMGLNGREFVATQYSWNNSVRIMIDNYNNILNNND